MGFFLAIKRIFTGEDPEEKMLDDARARHGIIVDKTQMDKTVDEATRFGEEYDPWEDIRHFRSTFFVGGWASGKIFKTHVVGEDKVKKQLEELQKKRDEEAKKQSWDKWEQEKKK
jgi:hypothetical protein